MMKIATAISAARVVALTRVPKIARNAGSSVIDAAIIISTPVIAPTARPFMNARPIRNMPHSEISTVDAGEQHGAAAGVDRVDDARRRPRVRAAAPRGSAGR